MKNIFKRSTAWMLCLALLAGLFAGVPGAVITKANATETEATVAEKNLLADYNASFEDYAIPNWTIEPGVTQSREQAAEGNTFSLKISVKDAAATSDAAVAYAGYTQNASVKMLGAGKLSVVFYDAEGNVIDEQSTEAATEAWETVTLAAKAPYGTAKAAVKLSATTEAPVYFDDAAISVGDVWYAPTVKNADFEAWNPNGSKPTFWIIADGEGYATYNMAEVEGYGKVLNVDNGTADGAATKFQFYSEKFDVMGGLPYIVNMDMFSAAPSSISLYLHVWDNEGNQITSYGVPYDKVREAYVSYNNKLPANEWTTISFCAALPANAAQARILITSNADTTTSDFMFDNAAITVATERYDGGFENAPDAYGVPNGHILHRSHRKANAYTNTDPAFVKEGKQSYTTCGTTYYIMSNNVSVLAGETYTASVFVKTTAEQEAAWAKDVQYFLYFFDIEGNLLVQKQVLAKATSTGWTEMAMTVVAPEGAVTARTLIAGVGNVAYFDDETFTKTTNVTAENMLANAGFESVTVVNKALFPNWAAQSGNAANMEVAYDAERGNVAHLFEEAGNVWLASQAFPAVPGEQFTASAEFSGTEGYVQLYVRFTSVETGNLNNKGTVNPTAEKRWYTQTETFTAESAGWVKAKDDASNIKDGKITVTAPEGAAYVYVLIVATSAKVDGVFGNPNVYVDNVTLSKVCEHDFSGEAVVTAPTCNKDGASVITCSKCGATSTTVIAATGEHAYESVVTEPTCGTAGYTTNTCTICGDVTVTNNVPATGAHTADEGVYTKPTTEADGYTTYTCTACGATWIETDAGSKLVETVEIIRNGASAGVYYTMNEAVLDLQPGDTLSLLADVNKDFNLLVVSGLSNITVNGNDHVVKATFNIFSGTGHEADVVSNITIHNVTFDSYRLLISQGTFDNVIIRDCTFQNGAYLKTQTGKMSNVTISGCIFDGVSNDAGTASAIIMSKITNLTIDGNSILSVQWNAFQIGSASGEVVFTNNDITWDVAADVDGAFNLHSFVDAKVTIKDNVITTGEANADNNIVNVQVAATNTAVYLYDDVSINTALLPDVTEAAGYTVYCTGHNFVDGTCDICGAANATAKVDENLTIVGKDMLLGGYIGAQFTVNPEATGAYDSVYIVVVFDGQEFTYNVPLFEGAHVFEHRVAPKYMGEALKITAYGVKGEEVIPGVTVEWSIKDGIMERLAKFYPYIKYAQYKNRCILLVDMLYYGAAAQTRFGTDGNGLVTDGLDAKYVALKTATEPTIEKVNTATKTASNQLYQVNLGVEDAVQMQFTFRLKVEDYSQYVVKITANGTTYEYTGESFIPQGDTSTLKKFVTVVFDKLEAVNMRDDVTIELWQNGAKVSDTYTMSIEGFATASIAKGQNVDLLKAMIAYGDSAKVSLG